MTREERIQDILNCIRFDLPEIKNLIIQNKDLFEEDNEQNPYEEKDMWNEDYIAKNIVWLRKNFSKKRLEHLIEVRNYVRGEIEEQPRKIKPLSLKSKEVQRRKEKRLTEKGLIEKGLEKVLSIYNSIAPQKKKKVNTEMKKYDKFREGK